MFGSIEGRKIKCPEPLPPGLDEFLIEDGGVLSCCMEVSETCDIDVIPPFVM